MKIIMSPSQYAQIWKEPTDVIEKVILREVVSAENVVVMHGAITTVKGEVQFEIVAGHEGPVVRGEEISIEEFLEWMKMA